MKQTRNAIRTTMAALMCAVLCGACSTIVVKRQTQIVQYQSETGNNCRKDCNKDGYINVGRGFETYRAHPYLLVKYTSDKDKPVDSQILFLPDWNHRMIIKQSLGLGTSKLSLAFNGPMLASVNAEQDTKLPELLTAMGAVATGVGGLATGVGAIATGAGALATGLGNLTGVFSGPLGNILVAALGGGAGGTKALRSSAPIKSEEYQWGIDRISESELRSRLKGFDLPDIEVNALVRIWKDIPTWIQTEFVSHFDEKNLLLPRTSIVKIETWYYVMVAQNALGNIGGLEEFEKNLIQVKVQLGVISFTQRDELLLLFALIKGVKDDIVKKTPELTGTQSDAGKSCVQYLDKALAQIDKILALFGLPNNAPFELYRIDQDKANNVCLTPVTVRKS